MVTAVECPQCASYFVRVTTRDDESTSQFECGACHNTWRDETEPRKPSSRKVGTASAFYAPWPEAEPEPS
jgi:transposase-like protein